MEIIEIYHFA